MMWRQSKNTLLLLLALPLILSLAAELQAADDWKVVGLPVRETITGIAFPKPNDPILVTGGGKYLRPTDNGKTWTAFTIHKDPPFEDVNFANADTGMICGRKGTIYRTIDGMKGWEAVYLGDSTPWFTSVVMLSGKVAVAIGLVPGESMSGVAYRSTDCGLNWEKLPAMGIGYGELFYHKGDPLCFQSFARLNYSLDSGANWSTLKTLEGKTGRATAFYGQTGIICGNSGMIAYTSDRGRGWTSVPASYTANFTSVVLLDEKTGFVAGTGGTVLKTIDGGKSWTRENVMKESVDFACMQISGDTLYVGGADGVYARKKVR